MRRDIYKYSPVNSPQPKFSIVYFLVPIIIIAGTILIIWQLQPPEPSPYAHCPKSKYFDPETASHDMSDGGTGDPEPDATSEGVVDIEWTLFTEYPRGNQDAAGAMYKHQLFSTGGFCGGNKFPYYCEPRDFFTDTYLYSFESHTWNRVQDMPGLGRQGHKCETIDNQVYCMGGFSYSSPYSHVDSYKYNGTWHRIADTPTNHTAAVQICTMNKKIYLLESGYYTVQNETGMFYVSDKLFQYTVASDSWSQITTLPGTPRWSTDITCVNNEIYVLGGVSGNHISYNVATNSNNQNIYKTIIDNWKYNVDSNTWSRLSDTPLVIGNWMFQHYYEGFIFLIGGAGYYEIENNTEVTIPTNMNLPHSDLNVNVANDYLFTNNVYVYDTQHDTFIHSTPLPYDWNGATTWLKDSVLYLSAGELGMICTEEYFFPRHPKMTLQGKITIKKPS